jgi:hypothetical protein
MHTGLDAVRPCLLRFAYESVLGIQKLCLLNWAESLRSEISLAKYREIYEDAVPSYPIVTESKGYLLWQRSCLQDAQAAGPRFRIER